MELKQDLVADVEPRLKKFAGIVVICIGLIIFRLYYLQVLHGKLYRLFSEENSIREIPLSAARGIFWDRHGAILADNRPTYDLVMVPQYVVAPQQVFETLKKNLSVSDERLRIQWEKRLHQPSYEPISILEDVSQDIVSWVKAHKNPWGQWSEAIDLRGVDIRLRFARDYPDGDSAAHVLGYVREISPKKLKEFREQYPGSYRLGDFVGVRGLEEVWDLDIRGEDGFIQKVINAIGREVILPEVEKDLTQKETIHGNHLKLTLDARLQKKARDYFKEKNKGGAAVALDPKTGAVLLLYSAPSFDLNQLSGKLDQAYWQEVTKSPKKYLLNRGIQGAYPPGSTYKIVTATAALEAEAVKPTDTFYCRGALLFGNRPFHCWRKEGHGAVQFLRGLIASCDVYFYNLGLKTGVDRIAKWAKEFGLGKKTGIGLPNERSGLIPSSAWKKETFGQEWQEGETLSVAIGQGADSVTPLQGAVMIATVANGGKRVHPYLVESIIDPVTGKEEPVEKEEPTKTKLSPEILKQVKEALIGVVADGEGTAHRLSALGIPMGGKTGTAQVVSLGKNCSGDACEDHAWFVAFAPAEDPKIALAVLVEHGGHGSSAAAPLAGELIKTYLENEKETF